ncbi:uncharacterized protein LOC111717162 [Eurytemora carolleeae]|uniref:uncharacterized protein LOC111717162 n=1 Tax=Eurytemora carolleeae TaxID=1294199 RepID=UPI000C7946E8|nr:uncharacterized protein LOC111717162 [Eurytemora carolleeae]|eukprot:XP_023348439.1 uncharacterized protein LOC111717162 [Eurytemora affinis]
MNTGVVLFILASLLAHSQGRARLQNTSSNQRLIKEIKNLARYSPTSLNRLPQDDEEGEDLEQRTMISPILRGYAGLIKEDEDDYDGEETTGVFYRSLPRIMNLPSLGLIARPPKSSGRARYTKIYRGSRGH